MKQWAFLSGEYNGYVRMTEDGKVYYRDWSDEGEGRFHQELTSLLKNLGAIPTPKVASSG